MTNINTLYNQAELAFAAYATLETGSVVKTENTDGLVDADFSPEQAAEFATRYLDVVTQYTDTDTSFSATVFKDVDGNLTLAIRGTLELLGTPNDLFPTDRDIFLHGAGYDQIVAMYNWWQRVSSSAGEMVQQFELDWYQDGFDTVPAGAILLYRIEGSDPLEEYYLVPAGSVPATGELVEALVQDSDHLLDVTGHSLGGHLAMVFGALFPEQTDQVTTFNAPGFIDSSVNRNFFTALGGVVPFGESTTNVIADQSSEGEVPFSAIAGKHSRPGISIDIAIEDQAGFDSDEPQRAGSRNHSQMILTDSLAVYSLLESLAPALTDGEYREILIAAAQGTSGSYEKIVDILEELFGLNDTPLLTGNDNRDDLYLAISDLKDSTTNYVGQLTIRTIDSLSDAAYADTTEGYAYRYALDNLNPFAITGSIALYGPHNSNGELDAENYTENYIRDRSWLLAEILHDNAADEAYDEPSSFLLGRYYQDSASGISVGAVDAGERILFSDFRSEVLTGADGEDHLYGQGGNDVLSGLDGADYIEGGTGTDTIIGGLGNDRLHGGQDGDVFQYSRGDGDDRILDADTGGDRIEVDDVDLATLTFIKISENSNVYESEDHTIRIILGEIGEVSIIQVLAGTQTGSITLDVYQVGDFGISLPTTSDIVPPEPLETASVVDADYEIPDLDGDGEAEHVYPEQKTLFDTRSTLVNNTPLILNASILFDYLEDAGGTAYTFFGFEGGYLDDTLSGGILLDFLWGDAGNDTLYGLAGEDDLQGGKGSDFIFGGEGDDDIWGDSNSPTTGSPDRDLLEFDVYGGDTLDEELDDSDYLDGGAGNDWISGGSYQDILIGGVGDDRLAGGAGSDLLMGGDDADLIFGDSRNVHWTYAIDASSYWLLWATELIDQVLTGLTYNDVIDGGAGNDSLHGEIGDDVVRGGAGDDFIYGDRVNNLEHQTWLLYADPTVDPDEYESIGLSYKDLPVALHGNDVLHGDAGNDTIWGNAGDDFIDGGADNDNLWGDDRWLPGEDHGDDTIYGGEGDDQLAGNGGDDVLFGGNGNDLLWGDDVAGIGVTPIDGIYNGDDKLYGGAGLDQLVGGAGHDELDGGEDNDQLFGELGNDTLLGGSGDDYLGGGEGDDILQGGTGDDNLQGEAGNDTLVGGAGTDYLAGGAGDDTYIISGEDKVDTIDDTEGSNTLVLSSSSSLSGLYFDQSAPGRTDILTSYYLETTDVNGEPVVTEMWDTGVFLLNDTFEQLSTIIVGGKTYQTGEFISAFAAKDGGNFVGSSGDDNLTAGALAVTFDGRAGNDVINGSSLDDVLIGGEGDDQLFGGDGDDQLYASGGNNQLSGGLGDDTLYGSGGNDIIYFNAGDGTDIYDAYSSNVSDFDKLVIGPDLTPENIKIDSNSNGDLLLRSTLDPSDVFIVRNYFYASSTPSANPVLEAIEFVDVDGLVISTWGFDEILSNMSQGGDGDDTLTGFPWQDELFGGAGNDYISGLNGDDTLWGEAGNDSLLGGNDADTLVGGSGNDSLTGGSGDDIYVRGRLDGLDTIYEVGTDHNVVYFGNGIDESEINVRFDNNGNLDIWISGEDSAQHKLVMQYYYSFTLSEFVFFDANGLEVSRWDAATIMSNAYQNPDEWGVAYGSRDHDIMVGTDGDDDFRANEGDDIITTGKGNDYIEGDLGNDDISGGKGDDTIRGGRGENIYRYTLGDGNDVIVPDLTDSNDLISFDSTVSVSDVVFTRSEDSYYHSLLVAYGGTDSIHVIDFSSLNSFQGVSFSDGTLISAADIAALLNTPTSGDDILLVEDGAEIGGLAGNDILVGNYLGNVFAFGRGYGQDVIKDKYTADLDVIRLIGGIGPNDIKMTRYLNNLVIEILDTGDILTVDQFYVSAYSAAARISQIEFSDAASTVWTKTYITDTLSVPSENNDYLYLTSADDVIDLLAGDDYVDAQSGNDILHGGAGDDILFASSGVDHLYGDEGNDALYGGDDTDYHYWGVGGGNDIIYSGSATKFRFDSEGNPLPYDYLVIQGAGLTWGDIVLEQVGDDLVISFSDSVPNAQNDSATINDYFVDGDNRFIRIYIGSTSGASFTHADVMTKLNDQFYANLVTEGDDVVIVADNGYGVEIHGKGGNDSITGAGSSDTLFGDSGNDTLFGGGGNDALYGNEGNDLLNGDDGNDTLYGGAGADTIEGGAGSDFLYGGSGDDSLVGSTGNDVLIAETGDDQLDGGAGNDTLRGGDGSDTYWFGYGYGTDNVDNFDESSGRYDLIAFDSSVAVSDVQVIRSGDDLILKLNEQDKITVVNHFVRKGKNANDWIINDVKFSDGTVWSVDFIDALADQDIGGNYILTGDSGDNLLEGYGGADTLQGMSGSDSLYGGAGDDTLIGGLGNDYLSGGKGSDQYQYTLGHGNDIINNESADGITVDSLVFDATVSLADVSVLRIVDDLQIQLISGDNILIQAYFIPASTVGEIIFSEGTVWTPADIDLMTTPNELPLAAGDNVTTNEDVAIEISFADLLANDSDLDGDALSIVGFTNAENGSVVVDYVAETFIFTPVINFNGAASFEYELFDGRESSFATVAINVDPVNDAPNPVSDVVSATVDQELVISVDDLLANDTDLDGDTLQIVSVSGGSNGTVSYDALTGTITFIPVDGFLGAASFDYQVTDGTLTANGSVLVDVQPINTAPTVVNDSILAIENQTMVIAVADLLLNDSDVDGDVLSITGVSNALHGAVVWDQAAATISFTPSADYIGPATFSYTVSDGTEVITADVLVEVTVDTSIVNTIIGSVNAETLTGGRKSDRLFGLAGNDTLIGAAGDDLLNGGEGNDLLSGGKGDDIYVFAAGYGQDAIDNSTSTSRDTDILKFAGNVTADMLQFSQSGDDLLVNLLGATDTDTVTVQNWYASEASQLEEIHTDDAIIYASDVDALVSAMASFSAPQGDSSIVTTETMEDTNLSALSTFL